MVFLFQSHDHSAFWAALLAAEGLARSGRYPALLAVRHAAPAPGEGRPSPNGVRIRQLYDADELCDAVSLARAEGCTDVLLATPVVDASHDLVALSDLSVRTGGPIGGEIPHHPRDWTLPGDWDRTPGRGRTEAGGPVLPARMPALDSLSEAALLAGRPDRSLRRRSYLLAASVLAAADAGPVENPAFAEGPPVPSHRPGTAEASACMQAIAHRLERRDRAQERGGRAAGTIRGRACGRVRPRALSPSTCRTRLGAPVPDPFPQSVLARRP